MARMTTVVLTDDVDGQPATQTVRFGLDGTAYEIDLTDEHAEQMRAAVERYVQAARPIRGGQATQVRRGSRGSDYDPKAVRAWAAAHAVEIPARGRIPNAIVEKFHAAGY